MPNVPIPGARRAWGLMASAVVVVVVIAACTADPGADRAPVTSVPVGVTTTAAPGDDGLSSLASVPVGFVVPDHRGVLLPPVTGKPKPGPEIDHSQPQLPIQGGDVKVVGTVVGPDGPVEGAVVRLERWVGIDFGRLDVVTDEDGRYEADELLGGRYKVRAFKPEDSLATLNPQLAFLPAQELEHVVDLTVERRDGLLLQGALDRAVPRLGEPAVLITLLARELVDGDGVVRGQGVPAALLVAHSSVGVTVAGDGIGTTDAEGYVRFDVTCTGRGEPFVVIESSGLVTTVRLPDCAAPEPTTTTTAPDATAASTTTTRVSSTVAGGRRP